MTEGRSAATPSGSRPLAVRESMGRPSRPTTTTASTPVRRLRASTTSRIVAIGTGNVGFGSGEVKQPPWVDPLGRCGVIWGHAMRSLRLLLLPCLVLAAACGDLALPKPQSDNVVDTVSLYALSGTPPSTPSAYWLETSSP